MIDQIGKDGNMNLLETLFKPSKSSQLRIDSIKMDFDSEDYIVQSTISGEDGHLKKFIVAFMKKEGYPYKAEVAVNDGIVEITINSPVGDNIIRKGDLDGVTKEVFDRFVELFYLHHIAFIKATLTVEGTTLEDTSYRTTLTQESLR